MSLLSTSLGFALQSNKVSVQASLCAVQKKAIHSLALGLRVADQAIGAPRPPFFAGNLSEQVRNSQFSGVRRGRAGFSLIEIMLSMTIIVVVVTMAAVGIIPAMRRAAVQKAAQDIVVTADMARQLAMFANEFGTGDTPTTYGVQVRSDGTRVIAEVVKIANGNIEVHMVGDPLAPYRQVELPGSVSVGLGDNDLGDGTASASLSWFYAPVTGETRKWLGSALSDYSISVGSMGGEISSCRPFRSNGNSIITPPDLAPGSGEKLGFFVHDPRNIYRQAITVLNCGLSIITDRSN